MPGGGMVFYDYPSPGDLTVVITNDNPGADQCLNLSDVEFGVSASELGLDELDGLASAGLVELRVAAIDHDIDVLRAEVAFHLSLGDIKAPSASSLIGKLDRAAALKHEPEEAVPREGFLDGLRSKLMNEFPAKNDARGGETE